MTGMGISYEDFSRLTFEEFEAISAVWNEREEAERRDAWERARLVAAISIQPHVKNRIKPEKLLPLPWDKKMVVRAEKENAPLSQAERRARMENLVARLGGSV